MATATISIDLPFISQPFLDTKLGISSKEIFEFEPKSSHHIVAETVKEVAKGIVFLGLSSAGRVGLYPLTLQLFEGHPLIGHFFSTTFVTAWGSLALKSYWKLENARAVLLKLSEGGHRSSAMMEVAKVIISIAGGFLAEFPFIFVAFKDNNNNPIYWVTGSGNIIIPSYSFYMTINDLQNRVRFSADEKKLKLELNQHISDLERFLKHLPRIEDSQADKLTDLCDIMSRSDPAADKAAALRGLLNLTRTVEFMGKKSEPVSCSVNWTTLSLATLFSLSQLFWIGYLSYQGWSSITGEDAVGIFLAIVSVVINTYYSQELMVDNFVAMRELLFCKRRQTLSEKYFPKLTYGAKALTTAVSLTAFGTPAFISLSLPAPWSYLSMAFFCPQNQLAPIVPVATTVDSLVAKHIGTRFGDERVKKLFRLHVQLSALHFLLQHATPRSYESLKSFLTVAEEDGAIEPLTRRTSDWA